MLIKALANDKLELLPANMVIENDEINSLISEYNQIILDRKKLVFINFPRLECSLQLLLSGPLGPLLTIGATGMIF